MVVADDLADAEVALALLNLKFDFLDGPVVSVDHELLLELVVEDEHLVDDAHQVVHRLPGVVLCREVFPLYQVELAPEVVPPL